MRCTLSEHDMVTTFKRDQIRMAVLNKRVVLILIFCLVPWVVAVNEDFSKRLLLNDQDALARLSNMENTIQQLTQSLAETKTSMTRLETESKAKTASLEQSLSNVQAELTAKTTLLEQLKLGSTYVRWGRKQCTTDNTETVYSGFTTGQEHSHSSYHGGPSNNLCLPNNPEISNRTAPGGSLIYGSEFEDGSFFGPGAQNEDVPCALCRSKNTTTTVMFPGRETCYHGWKREYVGILASGFYSNKASTYICMDSNPEYVQGGERNDNENLFYATTAKCGSLPCPPYSNNKAVNCVVCSI